VLALTDYFAPDEISLLAVADHLGSANSPERAQGGDQVNRLENIRFALRIVSQQQVKPGSKICIQPRVIAEVTNSQVSQVHRHSLPQPAGNEHEKARAKRDI